MYSCCYETLKLFKCLIFIFIGYDTHADVEDALNNLFEQLNDAIFSFSEEMKARDLWDNVTIIQTSDFARTLNPNGGDGKFAFFHNNIHFI